MNLKTDRGEEVRYVEFRASDDPDGRTLEGYAAVFNAWTEIKDQMGTYRERIAPGAFKRSLGRIVPVLQFDHGSHPLIGSLPLGAITVTREDRNGLFVRAKLSDNWLIDPVRDAIRDGGITGMSFRFKVIHDEWASDDAGETRTIKEVELMELGPVVFPAYTQTSVAVRSLVRTLDDEGRAELARELNAAVHGDVDEDDTERSVSDSTSPDEVAGEPATDDSQDEPPVASHDNRTSIAEALTRFRHHPLKGNDVHS